MRLFGFLFLVAGWLLVIAALVLLRAERPLTTFVVAGLVMELMGLGLVIRSHMMVRGERT